VILEFPLDGAGSELVGGLLEGNAEDFAAKRTSPPDEETSMVIGRHKLAVVLLPRH